MRWSIIRTIWLREMRDQLRDRRTLIMIVALPLVLYPLLGFIVLQFAADFVEKPIVLGVVTGSAQIQDFPPRLPPDAGRSVVGAVIGSCAPAPAKRLSFDFPYLIEDRHFTIFDTAFPLEKSRKLAAETRFDIKFLEQNDARPLKDRDVDLILNADADFYRMLERSDDAPAPIHVQSRDDDRGRLALRRLTPILDKWKLETRKVRLMRAGLTEHFVEPVEIRLPQKSAAGTERVIDMVVRVFPVLLVMWCLAGALYPAVDLCAGEKERGTMETLLITPAGREEIVIGKFLTIWIFSFGTAIVNLLSMGITTAQFAHIMPQAGIPPMALIWCVVLSLPQSAFFSALALAIGAYARSSKEGQYYLMPLFVISMPLVFLTMAPGVDLSPFYSLVPVTGVALLMQKLMMARQLSEIPWAYFVPVLLPIGVYSWLALRWAIEQFNREEVLFREAERLDPWLWIKSLFRDKEAMPTTGQAFFALAILIGLRWLALGFGNRWSLEWQTIISQIAFVATPPILMAILLNTQPRAGLYMNLPEGRQTGLALVLALLMLPPMIGLSQAIVWWFPRVLDGGHPLIVIMRGIREGTDLDAMHFAWYVVAFALTPAICEEIAFRGFVLRGLHHGFRPRNAVFMSSFFFALFHLNVFLFVPTFLFGVVLGLLTVRSKSLLPAILFHLLHNVVLIALMPLAQYSAGMAQDAWAAFIGLCLVLAAALVWWLYRKPYIDLARREAAEREEEERAAQART